MITPPILTLYVNFLIGTEGIPVCLEAGRGRFGGRGAGLLRLPGAVVGQVRSLLRRVGRLALDGAAARQTARGILQGCFRQNGSVHLIQQSLLFRSNSFKIIGFTHLYCWVGWLPNRREEGNCKISKPNFK